MLAEWHALSDDLQLTISNEAMRRAAHMIADHAEVLAEEIENGAVADHGAPDALRLFAALIRLTGDPLHPVGAA